MLVRLLLRRAVPAHGLPVLAARRMSWEVPKKVGNPEQTEWVRSSRGNNFPDFIEKWNRNKFLGFGAVFSGAGAYLFTTGVVSWFGIMPCLAYLAVGFADMSSQSNLRRNFPVVGNIRYICEMIRPEIQQYFIESDTSGKPFNREQRSSVYRRAKNLPNTLPFGTKLDVYRPGYEFIAHSMLPITVDPQSLRITVGAGTCSQPYSASVFNVSGMSYGALSPHAILALNAGAKAGGFYHNTGEGSVSPHHLLPGGDIVWNVGTGYFGCRTLEGAFSPEKFTETAVKPQVKMIELKLSQGAKPAHGGILPADKLTEEIAAIRGVPMGQAVHSPPRHSTFDDFPGMMRFLARLRELSGGKPVGVKLCVGSPVEVAALIRAAAEGGPLERPDFITVDGGEGGTGAAPKGFSNHVGHPLKDGLMLVDDLLRGAGLRQDIRVIASGGITGSFGLARALAIGADACNSARGMMFALGCIQALKCHTNKCPTGVATTQPELYEGLMVEDKWRRVYFYQKNTLKDLSELLGASSTHHPDLWNRSVVHRRLGDSKIASYEDMNPSVPDGALLHGASEKKLQKLWDDAGTYLASRRAEPSQPSAPGADASR